MGGDLMAQRPTHLRVTRPGEEPVKKRAYKNITDATEGSSRDLWAAMLKALTKQLDAGKIAGNSIASAYREARELDRLIRMADAEAAAEAKRSEGTGERRSFDASAI